MSATEWDFDFVRDLTPDQPVRTEIDPIRTLEALKAGYKICRLVYDKAEITASRIVWALLVEAAGVERKMSRPRPAGFGSAWPDPVHTPAEIFAARAARLESKMPEYEIRSSHDMPTAAQISRADEVFIWLRFIHADDKIRARDVLWGLARGSGYPALAKATGLTTARLRSLKSEQLKTIAARLRVELQRSNLAAFTSNPASSQP